MLIRCAARTMAGGMILTGLVAGTVFMAGGVGAALLARRLWEERKGWKQDADSAEEDDEKCHPATEATQAAQGEVMNGWGQFRSGGAVHPAVR